MRVVKENIHRIGSMEEGSPCKTTATFTLDDDFNVPDSKPDAKSVLREAGNIRVLEKKCSGGRLHVKGILAVAVLYIGEDNDGIYGIQSEIPFDEMIHMENDECREVTVETTLEDISATLVHSRKINMKAKETTTMEALKNTTIPVLFIHGSDDHFVPIEMTYENYKACASEKRLLVVPGAEHAMSYIVDKKKYEDAIRRFWQEQDEKC